jgi:hypothetical protein
VKCRPDYSLVGLNLGHGDIRMATVLKKKMLQEWVSGEGAVNQGEVASRLGGGRIAEYHGIADVVKVRRFCQRSTSPAKAQKLHYRKIKEFSFFRFSGHNFLRITILRVCGLHRSTGLLAIIFLAFHVDFFWGSSPVAK